VAIGVRVRRLYDLEVWLPNTPGSKKGEGWGWRALAENLL